MLLSTFVKAKLALENFKNDERGVTAIEYAVIGGAIAVALIATFDGDGDFITAITGAFSSLADNLDAANE